MKRVIDKMFLLLTQILVKHGFTEIVSLRENSCFDFARITRNKQDRISFSYGVEGGLVRFGFLHSYITFDEVEKIIKQIEPNAKFIVIINNHPKIDKTRNIVDKLVNTVIVENNKLLEPEFEQLLIALEAYICTYILPFFDRVSSLQVVNDEIIEVVPETELGNYISGNMILKKLIIMKLCNNPKYDEYVRYVDELYQRILLLPNDPGHFRYIERYDHFKKLVPYLASGAYLDLIKE